MLRIRLQRVGRKHEPTFRLVLTESQNSTKSGKFLDVLGSYDPRTDKPQFNAEKIKEWMGKGARVTDTVHNLLINAGIITGKKINVLPRKSPPKKEEGDVEVKAGSSPSGAAAPQDEAPTSDSIEPSEEVSEMSQEAETKEETPAA